nr:YfbU family protein [Pseudomonas sp. P818]
MKPTPVEKLMLTMLCDIHASLGIKNSVDPELVSRTIDDNALWVLDWKYPRLSLDAELPEDVHFVLDVLEMHFFLSESYQHLSEGDRERVIASYPNAEKGVKYQGFDGNHESHLIQIASYLIDDLERFSHPFAGLGSLNSHCPMVEVYQRMLGAFLPLKSDLGSEGLLDADQIIAVLLERIHPSKR